MSLNAIKYAFEIECRNAQERLVLLAIANHVNVKGTSCWPSLAALKHMTLLSKSSIIRSINDLVDRGVIVREQRKDGSGRQISTMYNFPSSINSTHPIFDCPSETQGSVPETQGSVTQTQDSVHETQTTVSVGDRRLCLTDTQISNSNQKYNQEDNLKDNIPASRVSYSKEFEEFWKEYPRKDDKKGAFDEWKRAIKIKPAAEIIAAVKAYSFGDPKYIQYAVRWLKNRRWEDEAPALPLTSIAPSSPEYYSDQAIKARLAQSNVEQERRRQNTIDDLKAALRYATNHGVPMRRCDIETADSVGFVIPEEIRNAAR